MEQFKNIFIFLFCLRIVIDFSLKIINFRHLKKNAGRVPPMLAELVDTQTLRQIDSYNAAKMRFGIFHFLVKNILVVLFLFTAVFPVYTSWIGQIPLPYYLQGFLFFFIIQGAVWLIELPMAYYFHFGIEARFGFNQYTRTGWLFDCLKDLLVNTVIMGLVVLLVLWFLGTSFSFNWTKVIFGWFIAFALMLSFNFIFPVMITPIFYRLKPVTDDSLQGKIAVLVARSGLKIKRILVADESRKSTHANAMFSGIGKYKTVILFDTLVNNYSETEILAILAHEIGHGKRKHLLKINTIAAFGLFCFILFAVYLLSNSIPFAAFGINLMYGKFYLTYLFFSELVAFFVQPIVMQFLQKFEYEADAFSKQLLHQGEPLASALKKIIIHELGNINIHPWYEKIYYSHPSMIRRIRALNG
jgi:STE24 endopeptidase